MAGESIRLRAADLRAVYLLIGECCELGADPLVWRRHMLEQLNALLGAVGSADIEAVFDPASGGMGSKADVAMTLDQFSSRERKILTRCLREMPLEANPLGVELVKRAPTQGVIAGLRRDWVSDDQWNRCQFKTDYFDPIGWDDMMVSIINAPGRFRCFNFSRERSDPPFPKRAPKILSLFLRELSAISTLRLAPLAAASILALPPRLRDVLLALARGDNEKQIALRLEISRNTVHEYVRRLFARFGVASRGELLVRAARHIHAWELAAVGEADGCWFYQRGVA